jgi:integrase
LYAELRACRRRCAGKPFIDHRTPRRHDCDDRCAVHVCRPLAVSSIRQCHAVLSSAYSAAVRWGWIAFDPMDAAQKPRLPAPDPDPPSSEEAARIAAAWAEDDDWGLLVWMLLVTGARRGEVLALRWENLDLATGVLTIRHSVSEQGGTTTIKGTKTHRSRRISLDAANGGAADRAPPAADRALCRTRCPGSTTSCSCSPTSPTTPALPERRHPPQRPVRHTRQRRRLPSPARTGHLRPHAR